MENTVVQQSTQLQNHFHDAKFDFSAFLKG